MKIERFQHLAEAYGAEIDRWPQHERSPARTLAERSAEAQQALAQARILDAWLSLPETDADDARVERVFSAITSRLDRPLPAVGAGPLLAARRTPARAFWPTAGFLVLMGLSGFTLGRTGMVPPPAATVTASSGFSSLIASNAQSIAWAK